MAIGAYASLGGQTVYNIPTTAPMSSNPAAYASLGGQTVLNTQSGQSYAVPKAQDPAAGVRVSNTSNTNTQTNSGGGGRTITEQDALKLGLDWNNLPGGYSRAQSGPSPDALAEQARGEINAGYDSYFSQLDQMLGSLPQQQKGQEQIVENNYAQGVSELGSQKESSMADLNTQRRKTGEAQVKSLADIAENIRSLFQTGNVMLGTRGAGDSSAADRYSYAVTKLGSKQRGDVMAQTRSIENDIQDREAKLNNIVTQETQKLKTNRDNQILQVAQYFQDATNQLLQAKAQGQLQKGQSLASLSTQLLQVAQQRLMAADADFRNRQNSLMSWAESNSKTIGELKSNLAALGQYNAPAVQAGQVNGVPTFDAQGNMSAPLWSTGSSSTEKKDIYGNPIR